jgi:hypothetical protein
MQATGVRRVVVVSAAPVGTVPSPSRPKPLSGSCRTAYGQNVRGGWQLSRADVAHLITRSISPG